MLVNEPKMKLVQKALVGVLAVFFGFAAATRSAPGAVATHCCCASDAVSCPTSCCDDSPVREESPAAPVSVPSYRGGEWQTLASVMAEQVASHEAAIRVLPPLCFSFPPSRAVPIFQRDCSYVI